MAISQSVVKAFNEQLNRELFSEYLYLSMAAWFESLNLKGFGNWMRVQAQEEHTHAMLFYNFILDRGGIVALDKIDRPDQKWDSPLAAISKALEHEEFITRNINDLFDVSLAAKDHAAHSFLKFFLDEQVEEEKNASEIVGKLKLIGDSASGLFMLDTELGQRVFTPPAVAGAGATPAP
jgi:ferritin